MLALVTASAASCAPRSGAVSVRHPPALSLEPPVLVHRDNVHTYQLDNGMTLVVLPDRNTNLVKVDVRYRAGAAEDPPGRAGLAHVIEHMTFQLHTRGSDGPTLRDRLAAEALYHNAYTNWDEIHFTAVGFTEQLASLLAMEAIRMQGRCVQLDQASFAREREVVRNEIRSRAGGSSSGQAVPGATVHDVVRAAAYGDHHAYARSMGGSDHELVAITHKDVCDFMDAHLTPDRAILVVSGAIDPDSVSRLVDEFFSSITKRATAPRTPVRAVTLRGTRSQHLLEVDQPTAYIAFPGSRLLSKPAAYEHLLAELLQDRLATLTSGPGIADAVRVTEINVRQIGGTRAPLLLVSLSVRDATELEDAVTVVFDRMESLLGDIDDAQLFDLRERRRAAILRAAEPFMNEGVIFADYMQYALHSDFLVRDLEVLAGISRGALARLAETRFHREASHVAYVIPSGQTRSAEQRAALRFDEKKYDLREWRTPVDAGEAERAVPITRPRIPPRIRSFTLNNGLRVMLAPSLEYPVVDIRLVYPAGTLHDPPGKSGLARMAMLLLERGQPGPRDAAEALAILRTRAMGGDTARYMDEQTTTFRVTGLSMYLDGLLWDLHWLLEHGVYRQRSLAAVRQVVARSTTANGSRSDDARAMIRALYGPRHPYTAKSDDVSVVQRISAAELTAFRRAHHRTRGATLIVSGKFDAHAAENEIRRLFSWGQPTPAPPLPEVPHATSPGWSQHLAAFDENQTQVYIAFAFATRPGFSRVHAERLVLAEMVRDEVSALRQILGATYGVDVDQVSRRGPGMFKISASVDRERASDGFAALRRALVRLRSGAARDNFVRARRKVLRKVLADSLTSESVADELELMVTYDLPRGYYGDLARRIAELRVGDIQTVLAGELAERHQVIMLRGKQSVVEATYQSAGVTEYRVVE